METIRVGQLIERLSKLDKHDKVYCGGAPVADGPEPVASKGCVDLDPGHRAALPSVDVDALETKIKDLLEEIASIKLDVSAVLDNLDAGEVFEATYALRQLIK